MVAFSRAYSFLTLHFKIYEDIQQHILELKGHLLCRNKVDSEFHPYFFLFDIQKDRIKNTMQNSAQIL